MFYYNALNLEQIGGGNQIKQGDSGSRFSYKLENEKNQELDNFDTKVAYINLVLDDKIVFTTTATVDKSTVTFNIDKAIPVGLYFLEIKIDNYIFPSDRQTIIFVQSGSVAYDLKDLVPNYDTNMTLSSILSDLSQKGIDISDLKTKMNAIYNNALSDHTEITQARGGLPTLGARLDGLDAEDADLQSQINTNKTSITNTDSRIDNLIAYAGNTEGNAELLDQRIDADGTRHATSGSSLRYSQKGRLIDFKETAFAYGYKSFIPLPWEYQSINSTTGQDIVDTVSIRTPNSNKLSFSENIIVQNNNTALYRWRWVIYNSDGSFNSYIGWKTNVINTMTADPSLLYRLQIATTNGTTINLDDALRSIKFFYASESIGYTYDDIYSVTDYLLSIGAGASPKFSKNGYVITVTLPSYSLFYTNNKGSLVAKSPDTYYGASFDVGSDQILLWNLDSNTIVVQSTKATRNKRNVVLLYNIYGNVQDGHFKSYYDNQVTTDRFALYGEPNASYFKENLQDKYYMQLMDGSETWSSQGMTMVEDYFWNCNGASDDHSSDSSIRIYDENFNRVGNIIHNINHMNTVDYNRETDVILIGNATDNTDILPEIVLVRNVSDIPVSLSGVRLDYTDARNLIIPFNTPTKQLHQYGIGACFGEQKDIIYLMVGGKPGVTEILKVMLGMGTNDLSDKSVNQDDVNCWGTYTAVGANEYNGTAKVLGRWKGTNLGVNQDCFYHNGHIYGSFSRHYGHMAKIELLPTGYYKIVDSWWLPNYQADGTIINNEESNGACLYKGLYYVTSFKNRLIKVPLYNKQGGRGTTGQMVAFEFPLNGNPFVNVTPTTNITDLYISSLDNKGFTVSSASGGTGTFNWECMID